MAANQIPPSEPEDATQQPEPLSWGQNLLGITHISDDFYEDIPLEFFLGDDESNKFFHEGVKQPRKPGGNLLGITYLADDFDTPLPEDVLQDFGL